MSLFIFRGLSRNKVDYKEYVDAMVHSLEQWMDCRNRTFSELFLSASGSSRQGDAEPRQWYETTSLFDARIFSPQSTQQVEEALFSVCKDNVVPPNEWSFGAGVHMYQVSQSPPAYHISTGQIQHAHYLHIHVPSSCLSVSLTLCLSDSLTL
jgi:hypothetical protein